MPKHSEKLSELAWPSRVGTSVVTRYARDFVYVGSPECFTQYQVYGRPSWLRSKEFACQFRRCRRLGFEPQVGKIPWRRKWQPTTVLLPGDSQGQRGLEGHRPRGREEWHLAKHMHTKYVTEVFSLCWSVTLACSFGEPRAKFPSYLCLKKAFIF